VYDWEVDLVTSFFYIFYSILIQGSDDKICWTPFKRWKFEVRSFYRAFSFPTSSIFLERAFGELRLKLAFFVWTTTLGKVLTLGNLRKKQVIMVDCCMCKRILESINHLLLYYEVARDL
jgi:hypothetical protein